VWNDVTQQSPEQWLCAGYATVEGSKLLHAKRNASIPTNTTLFETPLKRKRAVQNDSPIKKGLHLHQKQRRLSQLPWRAGIWRGWSVRLVQYDPFECQFESQCFCERSLHATHLVATERTLASKTKPHVLAPRSENDGMASWRPTCCCSYWYVRRTRAYYRSCSTNTINLIAL
jgi:hypothetical protein